MFRKFVLTLGRRGPNFQTLAQATATTMKTARFSPVVLAVAAVVACLAASAVGKPGVALVVPPSGDVTEGPDVSFDICVSLVSGGPVRSQQGVVWPGWNE